MTNGIHGYDHIANVLLEVAEPKMVTRKDGFFKMKLPLDTDVLGLSTRLRRELRAFVGARLLSLSFDRTTGRTAEAWIVVPSDPMAVQFGTFSYGGDQS